jgi:hypothetical protein
MQSAETGRHEDETRAYPDWGAPVFVWGVWGLMLLAALTLVLRYTDDLPIGDLWPMVPQLTGEQPVTFSWLWEPWQSGEHRIPLPKLVILTMFSLSSSKDSALIAYNASSYSTSRSV